MGQRLRNLLSLVCLAGLVSCQTDLEPEKKVVTNGMPEDVADAVAKSSGAEVTAIGEDGMPTYIAGDLGRAPRNMDARVAESAMRSQIETIAPMFRLTADDLRFTRMATDNLGFRHLRYQQKANGLDVIGGELVVHVDHRNVTYAVNGSAKGFSIPATPSLALDAAKAVIRNHVLYSGLALGASRLVYVISSKDRSAHLAWEIVAEGEREGDPARDFIYVDANDGSIADVHPTIHTALNRETHNLNHSTALPGPMARTEGQAPNADVDVNFAHDYAGDTYNCYKTLYNRDSFDNAGAKLIASVHYSTNYVNAFWNSTQMVYGDGDGTTAIQLDRALDVVAHEITNAVTEKESALVYMNEPGALNESNSDVFSSICEWWKDGKVISGDTWLVGEDVWTPATAGDALRYINDPFKDGSSSDYYPDRFTGTGDNGGVHYNSGIGNLAYYLSVAGGQHPRGKTTIMVTGLGMEKAAQIWYRAATTYYTSNSQFADARAATIQAAVDLNPSDGGAAKKTMEDAWTAVGVGPPVPPPDLVVLQKDVAVNGVSGPPERSYAIDVPAGATSVSFTTSGTGTGDADLYVKKGSMPTTTSYDGKSEGTTIAETVAITTNVSAARYFALVHAYTAYNGLTIKATYVMGGGGGGGTLENNVPVNIASGAKASETRYTFVVPSTATKVTFTTVGSTSGSGDADLYVRLGAAPTTTAYTAASYGSTRTETINITAGTKAGTWNVLVYGYTAYTGVTLKATYSTSSGGSQTWTLPAAITGNEYRQTFQVPAGAANLRFAISGGFGDADLYVRFGAAPTTSTWDYRPYLNGNAETVTIAAPQTGTYYLMVRAYSSYSGVTMTASYQ